MELKDSYKIIAATAASLTTIYAVGAAFYLHNAAKLDEIKNEQISNIKNELSKKDDYENKFNSLLIEKRTLEGKLYESKLEEERLTKKNNLLIDEKCEEKYRDSIVKNTTLREELSILKKRYELVVKDNSKPVNQDTVPKEKYIVLEEQLKSTQNQADDFRKSYLEAKSELEKKVKDETKSKDEKVSSFDTLSQSIKGVTSDDATAILVAGIPKIGGVSAGELGNSYRMLFSADKLAVIKACYMHIKKPINADGMQELLNGMTSSDKSAAVQILMK